MSATPKARSVARSLASGTPPPRLRRGVSSASLFAPSEVGTIETVDYLAMESSPPVPTVRRRRAGGGCFGRSRRFNRDYSFAPPVCTWSGRMQTVAGIGAATATRVGGAHPTQLQKYCILIAFLAFRNDRSWVFRVRNQGGTCASHRALTDAIGTVPIGQLDVLENVH